MSFCSFLSRCYCRVGYVLRVTVQELVEVFFPRSCVNCGDNTGKDATICVSCINSVKFLQGSFCIKCGKNLEQNTSMCIRCAAFNSHLSALESVFEYDDISKNMVLQFKFYGDISNIKIYAGWMFEKGKALLARADLIVPVPMHCMRLRQRKYNQSVLLARALSKLCGIPLEVFTLNKAKNTTPQSHLPASKRLKNVWNSFAVTNSVLFRGKVVVLIDDVVTTGASLQECARVLKNSGATEVIGLTLARTMS
ncbi:ComF family protein [Anaplasma phagocytophilum]|uniref:ComF family protein n=1 Tax=Anaplasma phagocytophilum TaxID=948 RepID=UPI00201A90A7